MLPNPPPTEQTAGPARPPMRPDPHRLRRAVCDLSAKQIGHGVYVVVGGRARHTVRRAEGSWRCDCGDFNFRGARCAHLLCVFLTRQLGADLLTALRELIK